MSLDKFDMWATTENPAEGSGIVADVWSEINDVKAGHFGIGDGMASGIDALGLAMDPLGSVIGSVAGYIIEHFGPFKWLLDFLAGDPEAVKEEAKKWKEEYVKDVKGQAKEIQRLRDEAKQHWTAEAQKAFDDEVHHLNWAMWDLKEAGRGIGEMMLIAAGLVGAVRAIIRDLAADFIAASVVELLAGIALAPETAGVSLAMAVEETEKNAGLALTQCLKEVVKLVAKLKVCEKIMSKLTKVFEDISAKVARSFRKSVDKAEEKLEAWRAAGRGEFKPLGKEAGKTTAKDLPPEETKGSENASENDDEWDRDVPRIR